MPRRPKFGGSCKTTLEILPTSPFVFLYGTRSEAPPTELTGKLVLTSPESMPVRSIKISLIGIRKVNWLTNTVNPQPVLSKKVFLNKEVPIYPADGSRKQSYTMGSGAHEWPFQFEIPGGMDESVEGLISSYIIYELRASVDRGYMAKELITKKHIRVIRTLGRDVMETVPIEQINDDIWANKIAYKVMLPQKNHIMGTSIPAEFTLIPLKKGVEIGKIKMEVVEHMLLCCEQGPNMTQQVKETVVASMETAMPSNSTVEVTPEIEALGPDHLFDECYHFNLSLDLPRSLQSCRQSVDTSNIRIVHKLRIYVNLLNPEGHTSQLVVKNNVHLFISPNLPPGEDQTVTVDPDILFATARQSEALQTAPPTYGLHRLDALYRDIDPMVFQSTPTSAAVTPYYGLSRNPSSEQLPVSLDTVRASGEGASPSQLHSRLSSLSVDMDYVPRRSRSPSYHSSGGNTPHSRTGDSSAGHSRHGSVEGYFAGASVGDGEYDMEALARTPSYSTAVRTPVRTSVHEDLPTYEAATSTPASPAMRQTETGQPSPTGSLDTLREETERNTRLNSRRASPVREVSVSEEGSR